MAKFPFKYRGTVSPKTFMPCPKCKSIKSTVFNSGGVQHLRLVGIGRERACLDCNATWRTIEMNIDVLIEAIASGSLDAIGLAK
jgi:hypothetical protein|tara:strand:- start:3618 stop:3869 length:252 start_codon:yes stop_codon:yes gene_type:complete